MKKRIFWTTAALLTAALGIPLASYAESNKADNPSEQNRQAISAEISPPAKLMNVFKVGEYQATDAKANKSEDAVIARIQPHEQAGKQAATIYVRNIPVITFSTTKVETGSTAQTKVASSANSPDLTKQATQLSSGTDNLQATNTPVWRATAVAAKLNQLSQEKVDANKITVSWKAGEASAKQKSAKQGESYLIKVNDEELVEINAETRLPDKTDNLAEDALQVTNRLRRQIGNVPPLREIAGMPKPAVKQLQKVAASVRARVSGMASWYGPGFHGNRTANGEVYNQNRLTAAHKSLPFGTKVRVTNTRNGRSVVVRINDRGPFIGGRIIDLSAAAARRVGVMQSGVAPVRIEILD